MAIADLKNVLKIFGGSDISEDAQNELYEETLLMTLARAANADVSIQTVEIDRIIVILKEHTGQDFSSAEVERGRNADGPQRSSAGTSSAKTSAVYLSQKAQPKRAPIPSCRRAEPGRPRR